MGSCKTPITSGEQISTITGVSILLTNPYLFAVGAQRS